MNLVIQAVYENGVFRPVEVVKGIGEGSTVELTIHPQPSTQAAAAKGSLSKDELRQLIRAKTPNSENIPESIWEEIEKALQMSLTNTRDPHAMAKASERMDQLSAEIFQREGLLDIVMPILREIRDNE